MNAGEVQLSRAEFDRLLDVSLKYNQLLYGLVDGGFADKRTEQEAFDSSMRELRRLKARDEEFHEVEKATEECMRGLPDFLVPRKAGE